jgi:hypothetical protein
LWTFRNAPRSPPSRIPVAGTVLMNERQQLSRFLHGPGDGDQLRVFGSFDLLALVPSHKSASPERLALRKAHARVRLSAELIAPAVRLFNHQIWASEACTTKPAIQRARLWHREIGQ